MSLEELVSIYAYAAIVIGTFFEGETILVLGGFSAHLGYLQLPWVMVCALLGSFLGDQAYFYIGRVRGMELLNKRPKWKAKSEKVFSLLDRHQMWLILSFRFLYGLRTVTPFLVGIDGVSPSRFFVLNLISAALWAVTVGALGYLFGHEIEVLIGDMKRYEILFFAIMAGIGLTVRLGHVMIRRSNKP